MTTNRFRNLTIDEHAVLVAALDAYLDAADPDDPDAGTAETLMAELAPTNLEGNGTGMPDDSHPAYNRAG